MSSTDEGTHFFGDGCPEEHGQDGPRVFKIGDPPPPTDVEALLDYKGGYWPRMGPDCWNCPGNEPHTWNEMAPARSVCGGTATPGCDSDHRGG